MSPRPIARQARSASGTSTRATFAGFDIGSFMAAARCASEAIKPVSVQLEYGPPGNLVRPANLVPRVEQEPAKAELLRGRGDRGGIAKLHEAFDRSDSSLQQVAVVAHDRQRACGVRTSLGQRGDGARPIELRVLEDVVA